MLNSVVSRALIHCLSVSQLGHVPLCALMFRLVYWCAACVLWCSTVCTELMRHLVHWRSNHVLICSGDLVCSQPVCTHSFNVVNWCWFRDPLNLPNSTTVLPHISKLVIPGGKEFSEPRGGVTGRLVTCDGTGSWLRSALASIGHRGGCHCHTLKITLSIAQTEYRAIELIGRFFQFNLWHGTRCSPRPYTKHWLMNDNLVWLD